MRAISEAIHIVSLGKHDPLRAHERIRTFYDWNQVATRTERVYDGVMQSRQMELWERMERQVTLSSSLPAVVIRMLPYFSVFVSHYSPFKLTNQHVDTPTPRTMQLGPFAGPIYTIILIVDCLFFLFLEWYMPREDLDYVRHHWDQGVFSEVCTMQIEVASK